MLTYLTRTVKYGMLRVVRKSPRVGFMLVCQGSHIMYARNVTLHLKANSADEFSRTLETDVLPMLRKQNGFKDELAFVGSDGAAAVSISMWDRKESADAYGRDTYPTVLKSLSNVIEGTPTVETYEVSNSTFHQIPARN